MSSAFDTHTYSVWMFCFKTSKAGIEMVVTQNMISLENHFKDRQLRIKSDAEMSLSGCNGTHPAEYPTCIRLLMILVLSIYWLYSL